MEEKKAQEEKEGLRAATPEKSTPEAFDLDLALDNNTLYKDATRIMNNSNDVIAKYRVTEYESYDQEKTTTATRSFVRTLQKVAVYTYLENDLKEFNNSTAKLSVAILNTQDGHYVVDVYRTGDEIHSIEITQIITYQSATTGASPEVRTADILAIDGDGNGFLNPKVDKDIAIWPAKTWSSFQFVNQTKEQHVFANAKYLQLLSYLERVVISSERYSLNSF